MNEAPTPIVLVTGGSRGIGAATAVLCARLGYDVAVNYTQDAKAAAAVVAQVQALRRRAIAVAADVSREADVLRLFATVDDELGPLTALVNNAGVVDVPARVDEMSFERLNRMFAINVIGSMLCAREAVRRMSTKHGEGSWKAAGGGRGGAIVNLSSAAARLGVVAHTFNSAKDVWRWRAEPVGSSIQCRLAPSSPNIHKVCVKSTATRKTSSPGRGRPDENAPVKTRWLSVGLAVAALAGARALPAQPAVTGLAGEWRLEFRSEPNPADPASRSTAWLTFTATVVQVDSAVGGAMRSDGPTGQFGCKRRGDDVCSAGRMRLSWDEQDWQVFEFRLNPGSTDRGAGRAEIRFPTGATDRYAFVMSRVR